MTRRIALILAFAFAASLAAGCNYERMQFVEFVRPFGAKMPDPAPGAVPVDGGEDLYRLAPPVTLKNPVPASPESIARGRTCYGYYCVQCHGFKYNGDGTVGQSFFPLPTDLRSELVQSWRSEEDLFRAISYGAGEDPVLHVPRHPPLSYTVAVRDRWHLINWIRTLGLRPAGRNADSGGFNELSEFPRPGVATGSAGDKR